MCVILCYIIIVSDSISCKTTVWDDAVPELARAGNWRGYYIYRACVEEYPVLEDLLEMLVVDHDGIGVTNAIHLIAAAGVVLEQLEGNDRR
jgi:hypothetical protein